MAQTNASKDSTDQPIHYKNVAFISYKRENFDIAKWLRKQLTWYRFPATKVAPENHPPHPKYIRPIIQDKTNLEADTGPFWESIKEKIDGSRFLIVLCSPQSARPDASGKHWVEEEIRYFLANPHRSDPLNYVIPVIVAGNPGAGGEKECLPPSLRVPQILNRTLPRLVPDRGETEKECRENVLIQVVSFLLRVNRDKIFDEYQRAKRKKTQQIAVTASSLLVLFAGIAGYALKKKQETQQTLAQADFQEASRLLDQGDTSLALAYLGRSLNNVAYPPALERLHGLLVQRSWLIRREEAPSPANALDRSFPLPAWNRIAHFHSDPHSGQGTFVITPLLKEEGEKKLEFAVDQPPTDVLDLGAEDGSVLLLVSRDKEGRQHVECRNGTDGTRIGAFDLAPGSSLQKVSPAGKFVVVRSTDNTLLVLSAASGKRVLEVKVDDDPTGQRFGFDEKDTLFVAGSNTGKPSPGNSFFSSLFTQDKHSYHIQAFQLSDGKEVRQITGGGAIGHVACSPAGTHVVYTASEDTINDWHLISAPLSEGLAEWRCPLPRDLFRLAFSPDGQHLVSETWADPQGTTTLLTLYDGFSGEPAPHPIALEKPVKDWAFSHDGRRLAVLDKAPELRVINLGNGEEAVERVLLGSTANSVDFSPKDTSLFITTVDKNITAYDLQISPVAPRRIAHASNLPIADVVPSPDKRHIAMLLTDANSQGAIELRTTEGGKAGELLPLEHVPYHGAFSPDGHIFAVGMGKGSMTDQDGPGALLLYRLPESGDMAPQGWESIAAIDLPMAITHLEFSGDGKYLLLAGASINPKSRTLHLYDVGARKLLPDFIHHEDIIDVAHFSPDGQRVATGGADNRVCLWDLATRAKIAQVSTKWSPQSVAFGPNGSVAYAARLSQFAGEVQVITPTGATAWKEAKTFLYGVNHVAFDPTGTYLAVGSLGNEVVILDAENGRPRTAPITLPSAVQGLRFLHTGSDTALCVSRGDKNSGAVSCYSPENGRVIGDTVQHDEYVQGLQQAPDSRMLSWTADALVLSPNPVAIMADNAKLADPVALTGQLGGWMLNEWGAPEPYHQEKMAENSLARSWKQTWQWLQKPVHQRTIDPAATETVLNRLQGLAAGNDKDVETALDIKPDFAPALARYWLVAARKVLKADFMRPVHGKSPRDQQQREIAWSSHSSANFASMLTENLHAKRSADFITATACAKLPDSALAWRERAAFLRLVGATEAALAALERSSALDPADIDTAIQLALTRDQQGKVQEALAGLDQAWEKIIDDGTGDLEPVTALAVLRLETMARLHGYTNIPASVALLFTEIEKRTSSQMDHEELMLLAEVSSKVGSLLLHFADGPRDATEFALKTAKLAQSKNDIRQNTIFIGQIFTGASYCALLSGDLPHAVEYAQTALLLNRDLPQIQLNYALALCAIGKSEEGLPIYRTLLAQDVQWNGLITKTIYQDFQEVERHGIALYGVEAIKQMVTDKIAAEFAQGCTVEMVLAGSQAEKAGVLTGDRILRYDNALILDVQSFIQDRQLESTSTTDEQRPLLVLRDGKQLTLYVQPGLLGVRLGAK